MPSRNSGTIRGGNNNGDNSVLEAVSNIDGSKDNKTIDLQEKRRQTLRKKYNDALAKNDLATIKKIEELRKKYRLDTENEAAEIQKQKDEEARREEILARAEEREKDKAAAKERRKEDIAIQKELAKEQLETATSFGEKMQAYGQLFSAGLKEAGDHLKEGLSNAASAAATALSGSVDKYLGTYSQYMSAVEARIQGAFSGMTYESLNDIIRQNTAGSPYVKYTDVLSNLAQLVDTGTMVNLAQRSFLATVSDKIATTFNAFDSNLLRIIKLQQMDTTASRLGMEAELTKLFNYYFSDSSYLTDAFDSVTASLTNLSSQLDAATSVELEYQVQKWLGALGSTGADSGTLSTIAQAINALGTGDVDWLTSNTAMQNLLVMASNRAGLDYSEMLVNSVSSMDTNLLLGAMIEYIKEVTLNEDGSYTVTLTADGHEELMASLTQQINDSCIEILEDKENYPNIKDIQHNAGFSEFTIVCSNQELNMAESFISLSMMIFGGMFQIFNGVATDAIDVKLTYIDSTTDQEFDSYTLKDTLQQMSEGSAK